MLLKWPTSYNWKVIESSFGRQKRPRSKLIKTVQRNWFWLPIAFESKLFLIALTLLAFCVGSVMMDIRFWSLEASETGNDATVWFMMLVSWVVHWKFLCVSYRSKGIQNFHLAEILYHGDCIFCNFGGTLWIFARYFEAAVEWITVITWCCKLINVKLVYPPHC